MPRDDYDRPAPRRNSGGGLVAVLLAVLIAAVVGGVGTVAVLLVRAEEQRKIQEQRRQEEVRRAEERRGDEIRIGQLDDQESHLLASMREYRAIESNTIWDESLRATARTHLTDSSKDLNRIVTERNKLIVKWPDLHRTESALYPLE